MWTDGSWLELGEVGGAFVWYEEGEAAQTHRHLIFSRRGTIGLGNRKDRRWTYGCRQRSYLEAGTGWKSVGFGMSLTTRPTTRS